jgi:hypothetical protein
MIGEAKLIHRKVMVQLEREGGALAMLDKHALAMHTLTPYLLDECLRLGLVSAIREEVIRRPGGGVGFETTYKLTRLARVLLEKGKNP